MKQLKQFMLAMLVALVSNLSARAYDFYVDGIYYNIVSQSNLEVEVTYSTMSDYYDYSYSMNGKWVYKNNSYYSSRIIVPENVEYMNNTYKVVGIGTCAFGYYEYNRTPTSGHIESSFGKASAITSISLPSSIRYISMGAFQGCTFSEIQIPNSVIRIDEAAFAHSSITSIILPESVTTIGEYCFKGCKSLKYVVIGKNIANISRQCFYYSSNLLEVFYLGNKYLSYGIDAFTNCHSSIELYEISSYIKQEGNSFVYSGKVPNITYKNTLLSHTCDITLPDLPKDAGTYNMTAKAHIGKNVDFDCELPLVYTITKAPITINGKDATREYGEQNPALTYSSIEGMVNGETMENIGATVDINCVAKATSDVGDYMYSATTDAKNYEITSVTGMLTIEKAPLIVTAPTLSREYGEDNPNFNLTYSGLKNSEYEPLMDSDVVITTSATKESTVGEYPIMLSGGVARNYELKRKAGVLTIGMFYKLTC